jgi:hypothetical protein
MRQSFVIALALALLVSANLGGCAPAAGEGDANQPGMMQNDNGGDDGGSDDGGDSGAGGSDDGGADDGGADDGDDDDGGTDDGDDDNSGSDGAGGVDDAAPAKPAPLVGLFAKDETWIIGSQRALLFGAGGLVELIVLFDEFREPVAAVSDPKATVTFVEGVLRIRSTFRSIVTEQRCTLDLTFAAGDCDDAPDTSCEIEADGQASVNGVEFSWDQIAFGRFARCDPLPESLNDWPLWGALSIHPLMIPVVQDPNAVGGLALVAGRKQELEFASVASGTINASELRGCLDDSPTGEVAWDGRVLDTDLLLQGQDNDQGLGQEGACSLVFRGVRRYCAVFNPALTGGSGASSGILLRLDGNGRFRSQDGPVQIRSLFILISEEQSGGGIGGGVGGGTPPVKR